MNAGPALPTLGSLGATMPVVPQWAVVALAGVVGLVIGSFLNVVVYRVPRHLSIVRPPSFCPRCRIPVRPVDNIPVASWLALGGRCRACGQPIPVRYPLVEAGTGLLFALVALAIGPHWAVAGFCALAATTTASLAVELDGLRLPAAVPIVGTATSVVLLAGAAAAGRTWSHLAGAVAGTAVALVVASAASRWAPAVHGARLRGTGWALLPAGAVLGWSGPVAAGAGIGALGVLLLVLPAARASSAVEARPGGLRAAGTAAAATAACVTAVVVALGVGPPLGR